MKVGIITYHRPINYGAVLQAVALNRKLKSLDIDSTIIDYRNKVQEKAINNNHFFTANGLKNKIKSLILAKKTKTREIKFRAFLEKNSSLTCPYTEKTIKNANTKFDIFVSGSDQVWNMDLNGEDYNYLLKFVQKDKKKVSIASSFGYSEIPEKYRKKTIKYLMKFNNLTTREDAGSKIIKQELNKKAEVMLDPTLLLNKNEWLELSEKPKLKLPAEYILFYAVSPTEEDIKAARQLSSKHNMPIVVINYNKRHIKGMINCFDIGPSEFVWLIENSKFVITNSFHGTAFSINLNKEFFVRLSTKKNNGNSRIETLLNIVGVQNRYVENIDNAEKVDWDMVNNKLNKKRKACIGLINKYINME